MISFEIVPLVTKIQENMLLFTGARNGEGRKKFMNNYEVYDPGKLKEEYANYVDE